MEFNSAFCRLLHSRYPEATLVQGDAYSLRAPGGFDLFACPRDPYAFAKITPAVVCRLLEVACQTYDWLIVDVRLATPARCCTSIFLQPCSGSSLIR